MAKKKGGKKRSQPGSPKPSSPKQNPAPEPELTEDERASAESESDEPETPESESVDSDRPEPAPSTREVTPAPPPPGAAWGEPIAKIERGWTWFEVRLLVALLLALMFALVGWISLNGMSIPIESQSVAGTVFRAFFGATALGAVTSLVLVKSKQTNVVVSIGTGGAILAGFALGPSWRHVGVEYFGQLQNWLQEGSSLTMFGGLRGLSTRFTIVLAFIGGSLAAASGKHINIDVALRFVSAKLKKPVFVTQTIATIAFCLVAAWGFFEYIAITNFNAPLEAPPGQKIEHVQKAVGQDLFLWRKQIGFDLKATGHVLGGGKWDDDARLNGRQWNAFLDESGYKDYFTAQQIEALRAPDDALDLPRPALAIGPEGQPRNLLVRTMNMSFTFGFIVMAFRFLLRLLLVLSGHQSLDEDEGGSEATETPPAEEESSPRKETV